MDYSIVLSLEWINAQRFRRPENLRILLVVTAPRNRR
jgi:hypothetical protein